MRRVYVGTCGFVETRARLFRDFEVLEVQQTFYQPPRLEIARRWRQEAPQAFKFTLKAWQLITHSARSPTYRRLRERLSPEQLACCGGFKLNPLTRWAWQRTVEIAEALRADAVVCQTPPSFHPEPVNLERIEKFFREVPRGTWKIVFEPRGTGWDEKRLKPLLEALNLVHGTDPFLAPSLGEDFHYFRLHGRPAYAYNYRYSDEDLVQLKQSLPAQGTIFVLFNNTTMAADARRFKALLQAG
jgi:uncharacterized protein YecE (DUF72 family)